MATHTPTARTATRLTLVATVLAAFTLSLMAFAGPVLGSSVEPTHVGANTRCDDLGYANEFEIKQIQIHDTSTDYPTGTWGTITAAFNGNNNAATTLTSFSSSTHYVKAVILKGEGQNDTVAFEYPGNGVTSDTDLVVGGESHIGKAFFCMDGPINPGSGSASGSVSNGAIGDLGGVSPIPTVVFSGILLASLGALAFANVKTSRSRS